MTTTKASTKIQTTEMALETVTREDRVFSLGRASVNGHSMPPLTYDADAQTVHSHGGRKLGVDASSVEHWGQTYATVDIDGQWNFGPAGTAEGDEKARIQMARARALIQHALNA